MLLSPGVWTTLCVTVLGIYWGASSLAAGPHTFTGSPVPSSHLPRALPITSYSPYSAWKMVAFFQIREASNKWEKKSPFLCLTYFFLTITINLREIDCWRFHPGAGPRQRRIGCALQPWPLSQHRTNDVKPHVPLGACRGNSDRERVPL